MGRYDSSLTRVQPVFGTLIKRDPTGRSWLPDLLQAAPHSARLGDLVSDPGELLADVSGPLPSGLPACFERPVAPSAELLRWLIMHPEDLAWDRVDLSKQGERARRLRPKLRDGDPEAQSLALAELERLGPTRSSRRWWAFEGVTKVDCWLETDRLVLFVEGKRTESLSGATAWLPARNQLIRNLDLAAHHSPGKPGFVLLVVENLIREPKEGEFEAAAPHLQGDAFETLSDRYLGQLRWQQICDLTRLDYRALPDEIA